MIDKKFERLASHSMQFSDAAGTINYLDRGAGRPLVFLHGGHGGWFHWIENVEPVAESRRVIAPDMPGFGASSTPQSFSLHIAANRILDLLNSLGVDAFDLVGFSFGACVASYLASEHPYRVQRLGLVNPGGLGPVSLEVLKIQSDAAQMARSGHVERAVEITLRDIMLSNASLVTPAMLALVCRHAKAARVATRPITRASATAAMIARIKAPVWMILGSKDPHQMHDLVARQQWTASLSPKNRVSVEPAGHWLQYERADSFNKKLVDFFD